MRGNGCKLYTLIAIGLGVSIIRHVSADLIIDSANNLALDVEFTTGAGVNTSYLIIDFGFTGGNTYAFAWNWNNGQNARSYDMLVALTATGQGLNWTFGGTDGVGFGAFVNNFNYLTDTGDAGNFWALSLGEVIDPNINWTSSAVGISDRFLADGSIDGWFNGFNADFSAIPPSVPTVVVPAPGVLLMVIGFGITRRRRSRID